MSVLEHRHGIRDDVVALTFDDGPSPWTGPILDLLAAHQSHATFFALGCLAEADGAEQTLRRILETGSEIGNHTFSHPSLPELDDDSIRDELERAGTAIEEASARLCGTGVHPSSTSTSACARSSRRWVCRRSAAR